jgi:hypothetical protein
LGATVVAGALAGVCTDAMAVLAGSEVTGVDIAAIEDTGADAATAAMDDAAADTVLLAAGLGVALATTDTVLETAGVVEARAGSDVAVEGTTVAVLLALTAAEIVAAGIVNGTGAGAEAALVGMLATALGALATATAPTGKPLPGALDAIAVGAATVDVPSLFRSLMFLESSATRTDASLACRSRAIFSSAALA